MEAKRRDEAVLAEMRSELKHLRDENAFLRQTSEVLFGDVNQSIGESRYAGIGTIFDARRVNDSRVLDRSDAERFRASDAAASSAI